MYVCMPSGAAVDAIGKVVQGHTIAFEDYTL